MNEVRVRFAPSPTGRLHLGNARTALFNYLFARKNNGVFILRIEDTDKSRSKKEYEDDIINNLLWLGLNFNEDPIRQSERISLYQTAVEKLIEEKKAYRCFCSKEELDLKRQEQLVRGEPPRYSGLCRSLSVEQVNENISKGKPYIIRLAVPDQTIVIKDLILGESKWEAKLIGDFIIAKSETEPLYHLATPIDDHYQGITHVIRGSDHLANAAKQIFVYKMMGWPLPEFAHLPLILGLEGKLSKRQGAKSLSEYRTDGFLAEALLNFMVLLGWHPKTDDELMSLKTMINEFNLAAIQKKGAIFNQKKLIWFNRYYLRKKEPREILELIDSTIEYFKVEVDGYRAKNNLFFSDNEMLKIIELGKERTDTLNQIFANVEFFFIHFDYPADLLIWQQYSSLEIKKSLEQTRVALFDLDDWRSDKIKEKLDRLSDDKGYVFWPLRVALTGKPASPPPFEIAEVFGRAKTIELIDRALAKLK
ncbi:MAG: glutamate--tRNA ligase [Patescibacteria group bacterium]|nr:glutamate--tRNA ligase [Patescibacteria group bacterium]MCL5257879.1 glutamate--tRNA ligase [Patescibacteria group bacterium]